VVIIEIDDQRAHSELCLRRARCDSRVVEDAKPHAAPRFGVVAGRPHDRKSASSFVHRRFHRDDGAAGSSARNIERTDVDDCITGGKITREIRHARSFGAHEIDVPGRVDAFDLDGGSIARRYDIFEFAAAAQEIGDRFNAARRFRMGNAA